MAQNWHLIKNLHFEVTTSQEKIAHELNNNASQFFLRPTQRNFHDIKGRFLFEKQTRIKTRRFTFFGCFYMYPLISGLFSTPQGVYLFHVTI